MMFDLSQVAEGLKAAVPPVDHLGFTIDELGLLTQFLEDAAEKYRNDEDVKALIDKIYSYEFH